MTCSWQMMIMFPHEIDGTKKIRMTLLKLPCGKSNLNPQKVYLRTVAESTSTLSTTTESTNAVSTAVESFSTLLVVD